MDNIEIGGERVPLDKAVQMMFKTLTHHTENIQNLQDTMETIEDNVKTAIEVKETVLSDITENIKSIKLELVVLTSLFKNSKN
jgi:esterase/lipase